MKLENLKKIVGKKEKAVADPSSKQDKIKVPKNEIISQLIQEMVKVPKK